jgi:hypothetical protein
MKLQIIETEDYILAVSDKINNSKFKYHLSREQLFKIHHFTVSNGSVSFIPCNEFDLPSDLELLSVDCMNVIAYQPKNNAPELDLPLLPENRPKYRVGKKRKTAVLDENGNAIVIFEANREREAQEYCDFLNSKVKFEDEVEKLAEAYKNKKGSIPTTELEDEIFKLGFKDGYKTATKKYSEEDLINLVQQLKDYTKESQSILGNDERDAKDFVGIFKQSLKQPKWFVAETVNEPIYTGDGCHDDNWMLKTTTINEKTYLVGRYLNE